MFRAVFWVILPCKMIVDRRHGNHSSTPWKHVESPPHRSSWYICPSQDNSALRPTRGHFPDNIDTIPEFFYEALVRAKSHPLHNLSQYTALSLLLPPPALCHWPVPSLSSLTTTGHRDNWHLYIPRSFSRSAYSSLMMEAVRTSETSVDNRFTRQYNPEDSSEHHTRRRENLKSHMLMVVQHRWTVATRNLIIILCKRLSASFLSLLSVYFLSESIQVSLTDLNLI
jgi:hypothetical protein